MNHSIRILFVEDDQELASTYAENFPTPEFEASVALNGQKALDLIQGSGDPFDVVVTDNYMPEMDGVTFLRKIRNTLPDLNVIMVTGYGDWDQYRNAQSLGVVKFLSKPVKMTELKNIIRSLKPTA